MRVRRFLYVLLCFCIVSRMCGAIAYARQNENETSTYEQNVQLLKDLGIYPEEIQGEELVSRGQMAQYVSIIYGFDSEMCDGWQTFADVPEISPYANAIALCKSLGLISGDDGFYFPGRNVNPEEVLKTFVCLLGYQTVAENEGGYPIGYHLLANRLKLTKGLTLQDGQVSHREFAHIAAQAFEAPLLTIQTISSTGGVTVKTERNATILNTFLKTETLEGILLRVGSIGFDGDFGKTDTITFANREIETTLNLDIQMIGRNLTGYIKTVDDKEILVAITQKKSKLNILTLRDTDLAKDSSRFTSKDIAYFEQGKEKTARVSDEVMVLYNGREISRPYTAENFKPDYGCIELIDNDGDNVFDVLKIWEYSVHAVRQVLFAQRQVVFTDFESVGAEDEGYTVIVEKNGIISDIRELQPDMTVLSARSQDGELIILSAVDNHCSGTITSVSEDRIAIDGIEYESRISVNLGASGTFYLDHYNTVVFWNGDAIDTGKYGYVVATAGPIGIDQYRMKLFTTDGSMQVFYLKSTVKLNGAAIPASDVAKFYTNKRGLIRYRVNQNGEISEIITPTDQSTNGIGYDENIFSLDYKNTAIQYNLLSGGKYQYTFGRYYAGADDTVIMRIPAYDNPEDIEYRTITKSGLSGLSTQYSIEIYDSDQWFCPNIIIVYSRAPYYGNREGDIRNVTTKWTSGSGIVADKAKVIVDDEIADKITVWRNGDQGGIYCLENVRFMWDKVMDLYSDDEGNLTYICPHEDGMFALERDLQAGDVIQYETDSRGLITSIRMLYKVDSPYNPLYTQRLLLPQSEDGDTSGKRDTTFSKWNRGAYLMIGEAVSTNLDRAVFKVGENKYRNLFMSLSTTTISNCVLYDANTKTKTFKASPLDIEKGDTVVAFMMKGAVSSILIIR